MEQRIAGLEDAVPDRDEVEAVLAAFAARNDLAPLLFDAEGEIAFGVGDDMDLHLVHVPSFPGVMAVVTLPKEIAARDDLSRDLLKANLSWATTGGGTFGRLPESGDYVFCQLIPLTTGDDVAFEADLLAFAERAQDWLERIELALDLDPAEPPDAIRSRPETPIPYA
ncbi:MAG: type III secretion system chaperone [Chromatiaceae bacterium]|nr:type III secretion system chaperone [Chromatiaceae bacterium]